MSASTPIKASWRTRLVDFVHRRLRANGRSLEITKAGWIFIGVTLLVGAVAINSGANLLHLVFGAQVGVIVFSGVASERMLGRVRVRRELSGLCFAGQPTPVQVELENQDPKRPLLCVSVEMTPLDHELGDTGIVQAPCLSLHVDPKETQKVSTTLLAPLRGIYPAPRLVAATSYPWGLFIKRREIQCPLQLHVAPCPGQSDRVRHRGLDRSGIQSEPRRSSIGEPGELRVYRPGDSPRRIDYKASARGEDLLVRDSLDQGNDLATFELPQPDATDLEQVLEDLCAASLERQTQGRAFCYVLADTTLLSAAQNAQSPQRAFSFLAGYASKGEAA